jgi:four helix bundle protein
LRDFRQYLVWEKAHGLTLRIYEATASFPAPETYGLRSQLRGSVSSIPTNIAEGAGRESDADFARFLGIAIGSASEAEYQLLLARDLGYLPSETYSPLHADVVEVRKMLFALATRLRTQ